MQLKLLSRPLKIIFILAVISTVLFYLNFFNTQLPEDVRLANGATLKWQQCTFNHSFFQITFCANYSSAEAIEGVQVVLPVVILRNRFLRDASLPPLLYLNGGPGYATGLDDRWIPSWRDWKAGIGWSGDVVLFDQRGTGFSTPKLHCDALLPMLETILPQNLALEAEFAMWNKLTLDCLKTFKSQGSTLDFLTTQHSAKDVINIMHSVATAMEYQHYSLYGVSYGTRLLLDVIRQSQNNTGLFHSVILDSIYPLSVEAILDYPEQLQRTIDLIVNGCQKDEQCNRQWPKLEETVMSLLTQLENKPVTLTVKHPTDATKTLEVLVNDHRLLAILFNALYDWRVIGDLPGTLGEAHAGDYERLEKLVYAYVEMLLDDQFEDMTFLAVECVDQSALVTRDDYIQAVQRFPLLEKYTRSIWDFALCADWPVHATAKMKTSIPSEIPALLLSGEYDPVTPVEWAERVEAKFNNSRWYVFPGIGHGVLASDACAIDVMMAFIHDPLNRTEAECLNYQYEVSFSP